MRPGNAVLVGLLATIVVTAAGLAWWRPSDHAAPDAEPVPVVRAGDALETRLPAPPDPRPAKVVPGGEPVIAEPEDEETPAQRTVTPWGSRLPLQARAGEVGRAFLTAGSPPSEMALDFIRDLAFHAEIDADSVREEGARLVGDLVLGEGGMRAEFSRAGDTCRVSLPLPEDASGREELIIPTLTFAFQLEDGLPTRSSFVVQHQPRLAHHERFASEQVLGWAARFGDDAGLRLTPLSAQAEGDGILVGHSTTIAEVQQDWVSPAGAFDPWADLFDALPGDG